MADLVRIRNTANEARLIAPIGRVAEPDAVFEIDRQTYESFVWPEEIYQVETAPRRTKGGE